MRHILSRIMLFVLPILLLSSFFLISAKRTTVASDGRSTSEETAIRQIIQNYFDALKTIDADKVKLSVYDGAKIFSQQGLAVAEISGKKFYETLKRSQKRERPI